MGRIIKLAVLLASGITGLVAQTTQGLISGTILDSVTGRPVSGATVTFSSPALSANGTATSDPGGAYFLPMLSPGGYTLRAGATGYQAQELQELELAVAGRIQIVFRLRPLHDVWEAGQFRSVFLPGSKTIVTFYGPDVDTSRSGSFEGQQGARGTLDTSVSYVIDPDQIGDLPLQGRDVYTMLVSLPGVTADSGTARGLGISVAGQRPSSSNYLLDGVENNNYLITGPLSPVAPEAVQEYRISTNNYSAEYGETSGFVANAITRAGGAEFHGLGYEYLKNDFLNAADFADNLNGTGRTRDRENQFGYQAGGPVPKTGKRVFFSSALEQLISHSQQASETLVLPTTNFLPALNVQPARDSYKLLKTYPGPTIQSTNLTANYTVSPPVVLDRLLALERGDAILNGGKDHLMARLAMARVSEPDFIWTPYPAFITGLHQNTTGVAANWVHTWTPRLSSELKAGYSDDNLWWDRAHPEVPSLGSYDGVVLPGSPSAYSYRNHNRTPEAIYSTVWTRNRHIVSAGGGVRFRYNDGYLTAGRDGIYFFANSISFAFDQPQFFEAAVSRFAATPALPSYDRAYSYTQSYFFLQDSYQMNSRLTLNFGLRYERFGAPQNTGSSKDGLLQLGSGTDFNSRLAAATLQMPAGSGDQQVFGADNKDFAPRFGFSLDPFGKGKTILRGGFGMFYDRPFDNLWQNVRNNGYALPLFTVSGAPADFLQPVASVLPSYTNQPGAVANANFPGITLMDPKLKNGYAETFFLGAEHRIGDNLTLQMGGTGSLGRRLITTDLVNRQYTVAAGAGRPNPALPDVSWRSSQGLSDYYAMNALARYKMRAFQFQAVYTWSHSIDNQSDPLVGDFFALDFTAINNSSATGLRSSFAQQYNSSSDRGNSEFDQRQNFFLTGIWQSVWRGRFTKGWQISWMAAFRSGLPYTVLAITSIAPTPGQGEIQNQRANLVNPSTAIYASPPQAPGGVILLNAAAFSAPANPSIVGTSGRDAFTGPGLYNINLSLGRSFAVPYLREGTRLTVRADAFNLLNHANLNNPDNLLGSQTFGLATYGRQGTASGFPAVSPVNETARQIQLLLRLEF
jgi:hypothetical protein